MGTSVSEILGVLDAYGPATRPRRVLDIGTQNVLNCTSAEVIAFVRHFNDIWAEEDLATYAEVFAAGSAYRVETGTIGGAWLGDLLSRAGMEYVSYDIFDGNLTTILDLNHDYVPMSDRATFDLVLNCGTTEHIVNQYNCLKIIHDATKVGGVMYHAVPMTGYLNHGYFTYTPVLFCDLARANEYQIVKMDFFGPQGTMQVCQNLIQTHGAAVQLQPAVPIAERWGSTPVPNGLVTVALRRTSPAPFRVSIETRTTGAGVAGSIRSAYGSELSVSGNQTHEDLAEKREFVERWMASILGRFDDSSLEAEEIQRLYAAYVEVYPDRPFPPVIEKKALDLAISAEPARDDLRARRVVVEEILNQQWPLLRFCSDVREVEHGLLAMDGIEAKLVALPFGEHKFDHAVSAFKGYLDRGTPEAFPLTLEFDALRYATEVRDPDDWQLKLFLGKVAGRLSTTMVLRQNAS
jgi:hypothetical protein